MSTRISSLVALMLLSACQSRPSDDGTGLSGIVNQGSAAAEADGRIPCALAGASDFTRQCTVDRGVSDEGLTLTVRRPDGGFRRLLVTKDGRGVIAADGAEKATVTIAGTNEIEVAIGGDRFRLPATVKPKSAE